MFVVKIAQSSLKGMHHDHVGEMCCVVFRAPIIVEILQQSRMDQSVVGNI